MKELDRRSENAKFSLRVTLKERSLDQGGITKRATTLVPDPLINTHIFSPVQIGLVIDGLTNGCRISRSVRALCVVLRMGMSSSYMAS